MNLEDYFKRGKVYVWEDTFAVVKSRKESKEAFAVIKDKNEITLVIKQDKVNKKEVIEMQSGYKLLTFDMVLPFDLVGFLAKISTALAEEGISILAFSSYSTDHVLVRKKDLGRTIRKLRELGFKISLCAH